jgi:hypothetical protein
MSGAVRAACCAGTADGIRCETDFPSLAMAVRHRAPRVVSPGNGLMTGQITSLMTTVNRSAHVSLVMPIDAAMPDIASAAVGQVSGSPDTADAGVC